MLEVLMEILVLMAAVLVIEDYAIIGAGLAVANGDLSLGAAVTGCVLGLFVADMIFFAIGRGIGRSALSIPPLTWIIKDVHLDRCADFFDKYGPPTIVASRFIPLFRTAMPLMIGLTELSIRRTAVYFLVASALYCPVPIVLAMAFGQVVLDYLNSYRQYGYVVAISLAVAAWLSFRIGRHLVRSQRDKRKLAATPEETLPLPSLGQETYGKDSG